jgi:hypothetical protein
MAVCGGREDYASLDAFADACRAADVRFDEAALALRSDGACVTYGGQANQSR